jgi:1-acyl-sn-glycerol-3-phosphate acyltransferase
MKKILLPLQIIYSVYAIILFVVLMLLLMPAFVAVSFFGKIKGGNLVFKICSFWADMWLPLIGIHAYAIHQAKTTEQRPCIFVANHISYMDIPMLVKTVREPIRPLAKIEMSKIPLFGFLYRNATVMVDRSSNENRAASVKNLKYFLSKTVSICIYPEGTFNTTGKPLKEFYDGAFRIAIETGTPIQPVIYPDTIKRMHYKSIFSFTPGKCRAVFLETIPVQQYSLLQIKELKQLVHQKMEAALLQYNR